jgi:hypothetical protein
MINCKACNFEASHTYCPNCGQPVSVKRINGNYLLHEIEHVMHFDRGILYTLKVLLFKPGTHIKRFLSDDRSRLVKPVIFIIITSLIYTLISHLFHIKGMVDPGIKEGSTAEKIMIWTDSHMGYSNIIMGGLIALLIKLFFRKYDYNYFEILILLCFVMGFGMLIFATFLLLEGLTHIDFKLIASIVAIVYCSWAIGNFFAPRNLMSYIKAFLAYMIGTTSYLLLSILIGNMIDVILRW